MFERCPADERCEYCAGRRAPSGPRFADVVYCVGAEEDAALYARAQQLCHATGLCREVVFHRPPRGSTPPGTARWLAHRAVARETLRCDDASILVLDFDIEAIWPWERIATAAARAVARLPGGWLGLHLAHEPRDAWFYDLRTTRVRSASAWAYVANRPLVEWLARSAPPADGSGSLDSAFATLPRMYALFPAPMMRVGVYDTPNRALARVRRRERGEALMAPVRWCRSLLGRRGVDAALRRTIEPLFDPVWYLNMNPDVADSGIDPLEHYVRHGAAEGRPPNVWFDSAWYVWRYPDVLALGRNPLEHYIAIGKAEGRFCSGADEQGAHEGARPAQARGRRGGRATNNRGTRPA